MTVRRPPPPFGGDWKNWANQLHRYLVDEQSGPPARRPVALSQLSSGSTATADGVVLYDAENGYPVVSVDGEYRQIVLANGYAFITCDTRQTAAAINTAQAIVFDTVAFGTGVTLGTPASRVVFGDGGLFNLSFSAQLLATSAATKTIKIWPRINGVDVPGSTIVESTDYNNATHVVCRSALFQVSAGDYLEAVFAVDNTALVLDPVAAAAPAPAAPAATLSITRISA